MRTSGSLTSFRGFTLIEILVTLSILAVLSAVLIGYAAESSRQTFTLITRERVIRLLTRARALSTSTFLENLTALQDPAVPKACGYGLHVNREKGQLFLFRDMTTDCAATDYRYVQGTGDKPLESSLDSYTLDLGRIQFVSGSLPDLDDVVFVPPNPKVYLNGDTTGSVNQAGIYLQVKDGSGAGAEVTINNAGQITWK
jgi:prepilin-type N-terminal cleavage/methylation domain-containing protein